ncbi:FMN-binding negative transcriptional regulator [Pseudomonas panipatensis]|uniref:Negative transcriptional regulator, PaiB family n=1 Tax=Pseudomonas panipatensis TaxID=428992 RepID=A0A1G8M301_9PSED|nr:FMN-binding negative transcriptional regulator [Pseudomonas panipatensis]SDI62167.1 negative transcriptional regulator, PaiB family [Pseudomonas panipatensis]SMP48097.1 negative transcriptional regulator, PaiB family [Pseudomonas panipatensis]
MYLPSAFRQDDRGELLRLIGETPLATLVTAGEQGLQASHLPLLLAADEGEQGTLYGHLARANPQWRELAAGAEAMLIFQGPDAYVSPSFYPSKAEHGKVVPTWNFIAVHAYGVAETIEDAPRLLQIVSRLTELHERERAQPWAVSDAPEDYVAGMLRAIVGFRLPIARLEGKWKLSQNRTAEDRAGVRQGLGASASSTDRALAQRLPE